MEAPVLQHMSKSKLHTPYGAQSSVALEYIGQNLSEAMLHSTRFYN